MNRMIQSTGLWWSGRSARERGMLAAMALLIAILACWLLVVRPAWAWRASAGERRVEATAEMTRLNAGLARRVRAQPAAMMPADFEPPARAAAEAAGLTVALSADGEGGLAFDAPGVTSAALFGWIATLKRDYDVEATDLTVIENADATLDARGTLGG